MSTTDKITTPIAFAAPISFAESSFFVKLSELKLNKYKLDTSCQEVIGYYNYNALGKDLPPSLNVTDSSFLGSKELAKQLPKDSFFLSKGKLFNVNSLEEFKNLDKKTLLQESAKSIMESIRSKEFIKDNLILSNYLLISYADLKKYKFYYWFAFPQIQSSWSTVDQTKGISYSVSSNETFESQMYLLNTTEEGVYKTDLSTLFTQIDPLRILFIDTCSYEGTVSSTLRNFLAALSVHNFPSVTIEIVKFNRPELSYTVTLTNDHYSTKYWEETPLKVSGWEKTSQGKLGPKLANLSSLIDPIQLASQATELNLKLMKWRLAPQLDLEIIKNTKVLILGSGTLGSYIGRCLLAWGVKKISFVDNGKVSFSNPVRQPLFNYEDCLDGGLPKAETAALNMKKIFPCVDATGFTLEVPMIGHPIKKESKEREDYELLLELIDKHDAIFLALDSREARWLPTLIGTAKHKIVINSALGFESYLVMRHGSIDPTIPLEDQVSNRLGCYFCNDIVAPKDSLTDRSLDQMCTVTRPGVALMASSLAVELLISILQSPQKQFSEHVVDEKANILGSLPHQLRGFLHNFELMKLSSKNFQCCTACSISVISEFNEKGWEFVKAALNDDKYLEALTGLNEFHKKAEEAALNMDEFDDSELEDDIN